MLRRLLIPTLVVLAAPGCAGRAARAADAPGRPRLLLFVSVDQMRFDYLTRFASLYRGGFHTLLERGAVFTNARYRHANTETGPGHAVLLSGRNGSHSGIIANQWYDPLERRLVNVVDDPAQVALVGKGRGASPGSFLGFTLGDILKKTSPQSRVVTVSMKDRSAVLLGGHRGDAAYWFESEGGRFTTSTYYMGALPDWLAAWNAEKLADRLQGRTWTRLLPDEGAYRRLAGDDAARGERDNVDNVFPHALHGRPGETEYYDDVRRTPFADELMLDVVLRAMEAGDLGRRGVTDVLAVSFSAADSIGHTYGPRSQEAMDEMLRLDLVLGTLLQKAEERVGRDGLLVALSADHGGMALVETLQAEGKPARRVDPKVLQEAIRAALARRFPGATDLIAQFDSPDVYLDLPAIRRRGLTRAAVEQAAIEGALGSGIVERVYTHADMLGEPPADDPAFPLFRSSFFEPRSPQLMVRLKPYIYLDDRPGGTGHGTYHEYDRHVPVVFMGARVKAGRYEQEAGPEDIAPTLGALLGIPYPPQDGRLRAEILTD